MMARENLREENIHSQPRSRERSPPFLYQALKEGTAAFHKLIRVEDGVYKIGEPFYDGAESLEELTGPGSLRYETHRVILEGNPSPLGTEVAYGEPDSEGFKLHATKPYGSIVNSEGPDITYILEDGVKAPLLREIFKGCEREENPQREVTYATVRGKTKGVGHSLVELLVIPLHNQSARTDERRWPA
jgi:hypothetical protein